MRIEGRGRAGRATPRPTPISPPARAIRSSAPGPRTSRGRSTSRAAFEARYEELVAELRGRRRAAPAALVGLSARARADRILDRPAAPPARAPAVHPRPAAAGARACSTHERRVRIGPRRADHPRGAGQRRRRARSCSLLKAYAAWATGSVAMLGSLADTGLDLIASLVTLFGVRVAAMPADRDHRFGHGKAEALAALVQVGIIAHLGARHRLARGRPADRRRADRQCRIWHRRLARRDRRDARPARLSALGDPPHRLGRDQTDHVHYQSDLLLNLSVIAALVLDQYAGLDRRRSRCSASPSPSGCSGAPGAPRATRVDQLMDKEWPEEKRRALRRRRRPPSRSRRASTISAPAPAAPHDFAQFHIWVDPAMSVAARPRRDGRDRGRAGAGISRRRGADPSRSRRPGRPARQPARRDATKPRS